MNSDDSNQLCLECGLCCNGVIFADGQLQPDDNTARLRELGLRLKAAKGNSKFHQPCGAFDGCRCNIYADRPKYCREFECLLLKGVQSGGVAPAAALRLIRLAKKRAEKVKDLLRQLGDTDERVALSLRFRRTSKRIEQGDLNEETADIFGQLTLAVHDLNLLLGEKFYPGS